MHTLADTLPIKRRPVQDETAVAHTNTTVGRSPILEGGLTRSRDTHGHSTGLSVGQAFLPDTPIYAAHTGSFAESYIFTEPASPAVTG